MHRLDVSETSASTSEQSASSPSLSGARSRRLTAEVSAGSIDLEIRHLTVDALRKWNRNLDLEYTVLNIKKRKLDSTAAPQQNTYSDLFY